MRLVANFVKAFFAAAGRVQIPASLVDSTNGPSHSAAEFLFRGEGQKEARRRKPMPQTSRDERSKPSGLGVKQLVSSVALEVARIA
jgi:hypothetical protein